MADEATYLSPLHGETQKLGAQMVPAAGWQAPQRYGPVAAEVEAAQGGVALADVSARGKIVVEGARAADLLHDLWSAPAMNVGNGYEGPGFDLFRLRDDLFFLNTPPGGEHVLFEQLAGGSDYGLVTATGVTHGRAQLRLVGPRAAELLSRLCGLDFHDRQFPDRNARQTSVAKTGQLLLRRDLGELPAYDLVGGRSLAAYLWRTLMEAGADLAIAPLGLEASAVLGAAQLGA